MEGFAALNTTESSAVLNWTRVAGVSGYLLSWRHISGQCVDDKYLFLDHLSSAHFSKTQEVKLPLQSRDLRTEPIVVLKSLYVSIISIKVGVLHFNIRITYLWLNFLDK